MYETLEHEFQPRITKALDETNPNVAPLLADVQAMLAKFDEMVAMIAPMPPLNSFYDEVARLRIVRAHLREVPPALKAGNFAKARQVLSELRRQLGQHRRPDQGAQRRLLCGDREKHDRHRKSANARQTRRCSGHRHGQ